MDYKIQKSKKILQEEFNITHSLEYISSLFRNKIPKLIADKAVDKYLEWYYTTQEKANIKNAVDVGKLNQLTINIFPITKQVKMDFIVYVKNAEIVLAKKK